LKIDISLLSFLLNEDKFVVELGDRALYFKKNLKTNFKSNTNLKSGC